MDRESAIIISLKKINIVQLKKNNDSNKLHYWYQQALFRTHNSSIISFWSQIWASCYWRSTNAATRLASPWGIPIRTLATSWLGPTTSSLAQSVSSGPSCSTIMLCMIIHAYMTSAMQFWSEGITSYIVY